MKNEPSEAKAVFDRVLELEDAADRSAYLDEACAGDAELKSKVQALLNAYDGAGSFMESPPPGLRGAPGALDATLVQPACEGPGALIGPYKLLQQIGEGGMGTVWMAEQSEPVRRIVAVKIIKPGMDSSQVTARFEAERQALAMMDHPHIARVLDAGTTTAGRPYFVMELVKGISITEYCDRERLSPRERLELFIPVCQAIQHAHQKGIIHRDIKPTNVLVASYDGRPVPKVIDFGVAKAIGQKLTERTLFTGFGGIVGTLEYMSPEQAEFNALDVDTRSDMYSLGVLLYELLTGTTPLTKERLQTAAITELLRVIREEEPPRPSTRLSESQDSLASISAQRRMEPGRLPKLVRGELDWIVMKALEKDRNRRYETASGLAQDIGRYLRDEPVQAGPPSAGYRLRKFVQRNQVGVIAVLAVAASLLIGIIVSTSLAIREKAQRLRAEDAVIEADRARDRAIMAQSEAEEARRAEATQKAIAQRMALEQVNLTRNATNALLEATEQRDAKDAAMLRAEGLRLTAQSELVRHGNPGLGLLLAVEGAQRHTSLLSDSALRAALEACREQRTLMGHENAVNWATFSPDGGRVLTCSADNTARVWDAGTGHELGRLQGHEGPVLFGSFSANGERLVTVSSKARPGYGYPLFAIKSVHTHDGNTLKPLTKWTEPYADGPLAAPAENDQDRPQPYRDQTFAVSFNPSGRRVASTFGVYPGCPPRVYETDTGNELLTLEGHEGPVGSIGFSPDGNRIVTVSLDHTTRVWDAADGKQLLQLDEKESQPALIVFSPDSRRVLTVSEGWSSEIVRNENRFDRRLIEIGWHSNRETTVGRIWDLESGAELATLRWPKGNGALIRTAAFSPDGKWVVTAGNGQLLGNNGSASSSGLGAFPCLWNAASGELITGLMPSGTSTAPGIHCVAFSPDSRWVLTTGEDRTARLWDAATGKEKMSFLGHRGIVTAGAFGSDGERVVTAGDDGTTRIWDATIGPESISKKGRWPNVGSAAWSPDGRRVCIGRFHGGRETVAEVWDTATGKELFSLPGHRDWVGTVSFGRDGTRLITGGNEGTARIWDAATGNLLRVLAGNEQDVTFAELSSDGSRAVTLTRGDNGEGELFLWDANTGERIQALSAADRQGPDNSRFQRANAALSQDGRLLALACERQGGGRSPYRLVVFDIATGRKLWQREQQGESGGTWGALRFSPDNRHVLTSCPPEVCVWDAVTGQVERVFKAPGEWFSDAAFSPDGKRVVTASLHKIVRIWDVEAGKEAVALRGHEGQVGSASFSQDGNLVVTASWDKTCRIWDAQSGKEVATLRDEGAGHALFSPDGRQVLTYAYGASARLWPVDPLPIALERKPRDLTADERRQFEIGNEP